jgi:hypothetical protein
MHLFTCPRIWVALTALLTGTLSFSISNALADDPPPQCTVYRTTTGSNSGNPVVATECAWINAVNWITALYPCAAGDDTQIDALALSLFNMLPPVSPPPMPNQAICQPPLPPLCPTVATPDEWTNAVAFVELFFPCGCTCTIDSYVLQWFSLTPPQCCPPAPVCAPPVCAPPVCCPPVCVPVCAPPACVPACTPVCAPVCCPPVCTPPVCAPACTPTCAPACPPTCNCSPPIEPQPASPAEWDTVVWFVDMVYPGASPDMIESLAISWFYLLPPCGY